MEKQEKLSSIFSQKTWCATHFAKFRQRGHTRGRMAMANYFMTNCFLELGRVVHLSPPLDLLMRCCIITFCEKNPDLNDHFCIYAFVISKRDFLIVFLVGKTGQNVSSPKNLIKRASPCKVIHTCYKEDGYNE